MQAWQINTHDEQAFREDVISFLEALELRVTAIEKAREDETCLRDEVRDIDANLDNLKKTVEAVKNAAAGMVLV